MGTASGAILSMGTVMSHNVGRQVDYFLPGFVNNANLLFICRVATLPTTVIAAFIASWKADKTGYLLIVAFDIVLATVVIPLLGCFYAQNPSPRAAIAAIIGGAGTRIMLEFALPKDGYLVASFPGDNFLHFGPAASTSFPTYIDVESSKHWDPQEEPCFQERMNDATGVDSLLAPMVALALFLTIQYLENRVYHRPLFSFPGDAGYDKCTDSTTRPKVSSMACLEGETDSDAVQESDQSSELDSIDDVVVVFSACDDDEEPEACTTARDWSYLDKRPPSIVTPASGDRRVLGGAGYEKCTDFSASPKILSGHIVEGDSYSGVSHSQAGSSEAGDTIIVFSASDEEMPRGCAMIGESKDLIKGPELIQAVSGVPDNDGYDTCADHSAAIAKEETDSSDASKEYQPSALEDAISALSTSQEETPDVCTVESEPKEQRPSGASESQDDSYMQHSRDVTGIVTSFVSVERISV
jgi:hypothetical protein